MASGILKWGRLFAGAQAGAVPRLTTIAEGRRRCRMPDVFTYTIPENSAACCGDRAEPTRLHSRRHFVVCPKILC